MDPLLSIFPAPLRELILLGGNGLEAAWGPLVCVNGYTWTLDASGYGVRVPAGSDGPVRTGAPVVEIPHLLSLPLTHWRARLAMVAAHLLNIETPACYIQVETDDVWLSLYLLDPEPLGERTITASWRPDGSSANENHEVDIPDLPTLPTHIATHAPEVALVSAIWEATR